MKKHLYQTVIVLVVLMLVACQAANPTQTTSTEFFKGEAGRALNITLPSGWVAKLGGTDSTPLIIVTDNWEKYQNKTTDTEVTSILVVPLKDKGTAEQVLGISVQRLKGTLVERKGQTILETRDGQAYAWEEYSGKSVQDDSPLYYFLAVITTETRSVFVFSSITPSQQETIRPQYQQIVKGIRLN